MLHQMALRCPSGDWLFPRISSAFLYIGTIAEASRNFNRNRLAAFGIREETHVELSAERSIYSCSLLAAGRPITLHDGENLAAQLVVKPNPAVRAAPTPHTRLNSPGRLVFNSAAIRSIGRKDYNPLNSSEIEVPKARAILLSVRSPGSRVPRSKSEMWTSWTPDCSARSICLQPLARRNFLIRSPVAAQMSLAMRP